LKLDLHSSYSPGRFVDLTPVSAEIQRRRTAFRSVLSGVLGAVAIISLAALLSVPAQAALQAMMGSSFGILVGLFL
jgi:hypothetical protein